MLNNKRSVLGRRDHPAVIKGYDSWNPSPLPQEVRTSISLTVSSTSKAYLWCIKYRNQLAPNRMRLPGSQPG